MKKLVALTLAALLAFTLTAASAATYTAGAFYTLDYPDDLTLDDTSYTDETTDSYIWLYMLYNEDYTIDAALEPVAGYEGKTLYEMTEDERDAYLDFALEDFADYNAEYVDDVTSTSGFPFLVFTMDEGDGVYYFAETLINGTSVNLCCYYNDADTAPDDALLLMFEQVLITIRPVEEADGAAKAA